MREGGWPEGGGAGAERHNIKNCTDFDRKVKTPFVILNRRHSTDFNQTLNRRIRPAIL